MPTPATLRRLRAERPTSMHPLCRARPRRTPLFVTALLLAVPWAGAEGVVGGAEPEVAPTLQLAAVQAAQDTTAPAAPPAGAPVIVAGDTLFVIQTAIGALTAEQRAALVRARVLELARNPFARLDTVRVAALEGELVVYVGAAPITTVTARDAAVAGVPAAELAALRAGRVAQALERTALRTNLRALALGVVYTILATTALVLVVRLLHHAFPRLLTLLRTWEGTRIRSLRLQKLELVSAHRIAGAARALVSLLRIVVSLLVAYVYLLLVFSFFPWTRGMAGRLITYVLDPVVAVVEAFVSYVPELFYIVVIVIVMRFVLKAVRLVFDGLGSGAISLEGFYADWAEPTYKIVRFIAIALAVILIWPHLPRSDSAAFTGVAAFLGLLLSLGSASAVSNIVSGVVMVYMRPFQRGDRVRIADTVGDVVEKTLLVTRVRTTKNVDVTIPNSMVLGSHITNYSSTARERGLVLHTTVTLGYDAPWRKVHETLIAAARATDRILAEPAPFVLQTALNDHSVSYELNAYTDQPGSMATTYSALHQSMQDHCNAAGIEILSPLYAAVRDGSHVTIPAQHLAADYEPPALRVEVSGGSGGSGAGGTSC